MDFSGHLVLTPHWVAVFFLVSTTLCLLTGASYTGFHAALSLCVRFVRAFSCAVVCRGFGRRRLSLVMPHSVFCHIKLILSVILSIKFSPECLLLLSRKNIVSKNLIRLNRNWILASFFNCVFFLIRWYFLIALPFSLLRCIKSDNSQFLTADQKKARYLRNERDTFMFPKIVVDSFILPFSYVSKNQLFEITRSRCSCSPACCISFIWNVF